MCELGLIPCKANDEDAWPESAKLQMTGEHLASLLQKEFNLKIESIQKFVMASRRVLLQCFVVWQHQPDRHCLFSFNSSVSHLICNSGTDIPSIHSFYTTVTYLGLTMGGKQTTIHTKVSGRKSGRGGEHANSTQRSPLALDSNPEPFLLWGNSAEYCTTAPPWD